MRGVVDGRNKTTLMHIVATTRLNSYDFDGFETLTSRFGVVSLGAFTREGEALPVAVVGLL